LASPSAQSSTRQDAVSLCHLDARDPSHSPTKAPTPYPNEMSEMALAHTVSDKVEAAYRRGDMREKRRRLMADWAAYCASPPTAKKGNVVPRLPNLTRRTAEPILVREKAFS